MFKFRSKMLLIISLICLGLLLSVYLVMRAVIFPVPVFAFHGIVDSNNPQKLPSRAPKLDYSIQDLEIFLKYLIENNYWLLSTQELLDYFILKSQVIPSDYIKRKPIVLTFDDGYKSIDSYLLPLLNKLKAEYICQLKIVLFINPSQMKINDSKAKVQYLSCEDIRKGIQQGLYDIQSHGYTHSDLTKVNQEKLQFELTSSQKILQQCTADLEQNQSVAIHFAYPYNRVNKQVEESTSRYYISAYGANSYLRHILILRSYFRIPRIVIYKKDSPEKLIQFAKMSRSILSTGQKA